MIVGVQRIHIQTPADIEPAVQKAAEALRAGGVILYPTDTLYGLGADALSNEAVAKIYGIKGRDEGKPIHALVADVETAERFADIETGVKQKIATLASCPITFICKKSARGGSALGRKESLSTGILRDTATFGFRIPNNEFCLALTKAFGGPITGTSANKSGETPLNTVDEILEQLGERVGEIDLVIDAGILPPSLPSTVVDLTSGTPHILREGAVPAEEIKRIFS